MCSQAIVHRDYQTNISFNNVINYWWYCTSVLYFKFISNLNVFIITIQRKKSSKWSKRASNDRFSDKARIYQSLQCFNLPALIKKNHYISDSTNQVCHLPTTYEPLLYGLSWYHFTVQYFLQWYDHGPCHTIFSVFLSLI